jgi:hypothetical protein
VCTYIYSCKNLFILLYVYKYIGKLDLNRHTIEKREVDVAVVKKNLEVSKAHHHDLITSKVDKHIYTCVYMYIYC